MMQMSIFVCGNQTEEFSQLVEVLSSFIILFVENPTECSINQSTDGARSVPGDNLLQSVQRFWRSVKRRFIGQDIPGATSGLSQCCPRLWTRRSERLHLKVNDGSEPIVP